MCIVQRCGKKKLLRTYNIVYFKGLKPSRKLLCNLRSPAFRMGHPFFKEQIYY